MAASLPSGKSVSAAEPGPVTIYPSSLVPSTPSEDDDNQVELGVHFSVSVEGDVVGVRYYKSADNDGRHTGSLWTSDGTRLATATFSDASDAGWQRVDFTQPVHLEAGTDYVASYNAPSGHYAQREWAFTGDKTLGNSAIEASSGTYSYGSSRFPTSVWHDSAYYVDVVFQPGQDNGNPPPSAPVTAPAPTTTKPAPTTTAPEATKTGSAGGPTSTPTTSSGSSNPPTTTPPASSSGAFPNASNTGVPSGVTLTKMGSVTLSTPGQVLQNVEVDGCITIGANADNVVIRNVLVKSGNCFWLVLNDKGAENLTIVDSELDGMNNDNSDAAIAGQDYTLTRVDIHGTVDGMKLGDNVTVQDSWIHDLDITSASHNDGMQSLGSVNVKIRHNTIIVKDGGTSAIILSTGSATAMRNIQIDSNLLGGGAYTVYAGYMAGTDVLSRVSGISVTNNKFTTVINAKSGVWGPITSADSPAVTVSGNTWYDGPSAGKAVNY